MVASAPAWEVRYGRKLAASDFAVVVLAVCGAQTLRFGAAAPEFVTRVSSTPIQVSYSIVSAVLVVAWILALHLGDTRKPHNFGAGSAEYRRVVSATFTIFGAFAVLAFLLRVEIARGYLVIALPLGLVALIVERYLWRRRLHIQRRSGKNVYKTMIVGEEAKVHHVFRQMQADPNAGFDVVAAVISDAERVQGALGDVVVHSYDRLLETITERSIDTVIITAADDISPERLQQLGWELDVRNVDLIVAAALTDVAGPRIHMRQATGFPLIYVDYPKLTGGKRFAKRIFDIVGSLSLLVLSSPLLLAIAVLIKCTSQGNIFYAQDRIGMNGRLFPMYKFRSMVQDADDQLVSLLDAQGTSDRPLHKIRDDPRITSVGRVLRRYSLDELPQLINVLRGGMSLVGPRPQREREVALYAKYDHRRLLVKPGITGLWQVSGRSALDWNDAIRLDLYYVENWSLVGDLIILWRTVRAVAVADGAT
ncbi:sugar transferase [Paramicrobacterium fandaimingii]|uniref:sugar transferase n=1 Tax=Paramicrobacterium fandaimingii TaxID=2708079 RepID=UPI0014241D33|nr:sugar transferase [Microbacterium fandaimingii]